MGFESGCICPLTKGKKRESSRFGSANVLFVVPSPFPEVTPITSPAVFSSLESTKEELRVTICDWRSLVEDDASEADIDCES
jgi:hypothetical protein